MNRPGTCPNCGKDLGLFLPGREFYDAGESIVSIVDVDIEEFRKKLDNKPVRRNVSLPNWLNKKANEEHINVSRVLQEALMDRLI